VGVERYRLKIYDGDFEVIHQRVFTVDVDLDSPERGAILGPKLVALTALARAAREPMDCPVLVVCDPVSGKPLLDWV
jgi:hypothetical protein